MTVKIRKSYIRTAVKETNRSNPHINTAELVVEIRQGSLIFVSSIAVPTYDFHIFTVIIHHLDGLFGSNIMTSSQLAC